MHTGTSAGVTYIVQGCGGFFFTPLSDVSYTDESGCVDEPQSLHPRVAECKKFVVNVTLLPPAVLEGAAHPLSALERSLGFSLPCTTPLVS